MSALASSTRRAFLAHQCRTCITAAKYSTASVTGESSSTSPTPPTTPRRRRAETPQRGDEDLIAPPDPFSNIRPIIYASVSTRPPSKASPYSASEFPYSAKDASLQDLELEWRLRRERVDMMNHRFWSTINSDFNAQLGNRLSQLPPASEPPTQADVKRKEDCLSQFYADWQVTHRDKQARWVKEWWREVWAGIKMQARVHVKRMVRRRW